MARKLSKRTRGVAARRRQIEGPPRRAEGPARSSIQQGDKPLAATDRGAVTCGWCGATTPVASRGRIPKWCSPACRHRAWEQRRAAEAGLAAVEVVDRQVEVVRIVTKVARSATDGVRDQSPRTVEEWARLLQELAGRLDRGMVYDRQLLQMRPAVAALVDSFNRRWGG